MRYRKKPVEIDAADSALLELDGPAGAQQACGKLAKIRLMAHQRDVLGSFRVLRDGFQQLRGAAAGCQRLDDIEARFARDARNQQLRGVRGPCQRTGQHQVDNDVEIFETLDRALEPRDSLGRERPLPIIWIIGTPFRGDRVTDEIEVEGRSHGSWLSTLPRLHRAALATTTGS